MENGVLEYLVAAVAVGVVVVSIVVSAAVKMMMTVKELVSWVWQTDATYTLE